MKNYIVLFVLIFFTTSELLAQSKEDVEKHKKVEVPTVVLQSFEREFPQDEIIWEAEGSTYEVEFFRNRKKMSALFKADGTLIQTEHDIEIRELPSAAIAYLNTYYKGIKIKNVSKIGYVNGVINYEAEVKNKDLIFDVQGKYLGEKVDID